MASRVQQPRVFYNLCSMIIYILNFPLPIYSSALPSILSSRDVSPAAFASIFFGISLALMLFGTVTFVIGFVLMPWVIGLILVPYFVGIVSNLSDLVRTILCSAASRKDVPGIEMRTKIYIEDEMVAETYNIPK